MDYTGQSRTRGEGCNKDHFRYERRAAQLLPIYRGQFRVRHCNITTLSRCFQDTVYDQELDESRNQIQDQDYQVNTRLRVHKDYTRLVVKPESESKSSVPSSKSISPSPDSLYPLYRAIIRRIESYVTKMGFLGWDFHCDFPDKYSTLS